MREIKFRGRRIDNGEWVYGSLIIDELSGKCYIPFSVDESEKIREEGCLKIVSCEVDPETVGEYTGLEDKNGVEIYEGDIVIGPRGNHPVKFIDGSFCVNDHDDGYWAIRGRNHWFAVIGNIHENTELLK